MAWSSGLFALDGRISFIHHSLPDSVDFARSPGLGSRSAKHDFSAVLSGDEPRCFMKLNSTIRGVVLMILSSVAFCAMSALIKFIPDIDSYKTTLFRFMIGMAVLGTAAQFGKIQLRFVNGPLLLMRGVCHGAGVFLFFLSITKLGLAKGTVISNSGPIFAAVFSAIFLREKIAWWQWMALAVAVFGLYLLFLGKGAGTVGILTIGKYELLALGGALLSGISAVVIKRLHATDSTYAIFFSQCVIGLWLMIVPANVVPCAIGYVGGVILLAVGITASIGQLLMTEGYRHASVSVGSLMGMLLPVFNVIVGLLVLP